MVPWRTRAGLGAALVLAVGLLAGGTSGADGEEPLVEVTAERADLDLERGVGVLEGDVRLAHRDLEVRAPRVELRYTEAGALRAAEATGGVSARWRDAKVRAPTASFDLEARRLTLEGGVEVTQGRGRGKARRASLDLASRRLSLEGLVGSFPLGARR